MRQPTTPTSSSPRLSLYMSAPLLNLAAQPGAQTGANQGIAAQAAQAQQAQGPMAGFEALLAALFGGQAVGVVDPNAAAATVVAGGKTAGKGLLGAKGQATADDAKAAADAATTPAAAGAVPDATLALMIPAPTAATTAAAVTTAGTGATGATGGGPGAGGSNGQAVTPGVKTAATNAADALAKLAGVPAATDPVAAKDAATIAPQTPPAVQTAKAGLTASPAPQAPQAVAAPPPVAAPVASPPAAAALAGAVPPAAQTAPIIGAKAAEPTQATAAKDKTATAKTTRVEGASAEAGPAAPAAAKAGDTKVALAAGSAGKNASNDEPALLAAAHDAKPQANEAPAPATDFATSSTTNPATLLHAAAVAVRGAPQTVANLAAQIAKKLDGRSTRFDVQLDPAGLGKVDVRMEIAASGKMSASMTFDTPQAAAELRARAGELQKALEQAGFDLTGGMSFDVATDRGQSGRGQDQDSDNASQFRGRAFQTALDTSSDLAAKPQLNFRRASAAGVDIRI
jgi:flagellar hook-length control protein FliK